MKTTFITTSLDSAASPLETTFITTSLDSTASPLETALITTSLNSTASPLETIVTSCLESTSAVLRTSVRGINTRRCRRCNRAASAEATIRSIENNRRLCIVVTFYSEAPAVIGVVSSPCAVTSIITCTAIESTAVLVRACTPSVHRTSIITIISSGTETATVSSAHISILVAVTVPIGAIAVPSRTIVITAAVTIALAIVIPVAVAIVVWAEVAFIDRVVVAPAVIAHVSIVAAIVSSAIRAIVVRFRIVEIIRIVVNHINAEVPASGIRVGNGVVEIILIHELVVLTITQHVAQVFIAIVQCLVVLTQSPTGTIGHIINDVSYAIIEVVVDFVNIVVLRIG